MGGGMVGVPHHVSPLPETNSAVVVGHHLRSGAPSLRLLANTVWALLEGYSSSPWPKIWHTVSK